VRGRVVDARTGEPIPAAQVFIADLDIGVLSRQDGSFDLPLVEADVSGGPLTLAVERIGYRRDSSDVAARPGETVAVEFRLSKEALQLDEVIVLGSAAGTQRRASGSAVLGRAAVSVVSAGDPALLGEDGWRRATRPEAEAAMGFAIATSPDLGVVEIELGAIGGIRAVRVRQALLSGGTLTLIETATDVSVVGSATFDDLPVAVVRRRGVVIIGSAPLTPAALEAELERIP
jgi:hypothetical protein